MKQRTVCAAAGEESVLLKALDVISGSWSSFLGDTGNSQVSSWAGICTPYYAGTNCALGLDVADKTSEPFS
jgi:hypothetical protein